jgi:hypothetical protein
MNDPAKRITTEEIDAIASRWAPTTLTGLYDSDGMPVLPTGPGDEPASVTWVRDTPARRRCNGWR